MKKLLILPGLLLLSAILPCGETHCADGKNEMGKPAQMKKRTHKADKMRGKWHQWRSGNKVKDFVGVNIDEEKGFTCWYKEKTEHRGPTINCKRTLKNVGTVPNYASTGTPPQLVYENYIGKFETKADEQGKVGSGKVTVICDGPCVKKTDKEV